MTLAVNQYGDNPFQPGQVSDTYVPDQLIAGNLKLVTEPIIVVGGPYPRGQVLGMITSQDVTAAAGENTGNGSIGALSTSAGVLSGVYKVVATAATVFSVTDPEGNALPNATVGQAYNHNGIAFTLSAGGDAFVAGDSFTLTTQPGALGQYTASVATASNGSQNPSAILVDNADGSQGPVPADGYMMGEFNANRVTFDASWTLPAVRAALRLASIFLKSTVSAADPT